MTELTPTPTKILKVGHTPDPDDAFMFYGIASRQVSIPGYEVDHVLEDIESLNQKAIRGQIDVTAISAAVYPHLNGAYWILPMGASVGRNYGPVLVKKKGANPTQKRLGVPGLHTTAYLLARLFTKDFEPISYKFDDIPEALNKGEIDYGVLIHEAQITYDELGFEKVMDLGVEWFKETNLPIPLGLDVVKKDVGLEIALKIADVLKKSIELSHKNRAEAVGYAMKFGRGLARDLTDKFVGMYVNDDTLDLGLEGEKALNVLFDKAYRAGIYFKPTKVEVLRP